MLHPVAEIILAALPEIARLVRLALEGDGDAQMRVSQVLPSGPLRTELARLSADARAKAKFGPKPPAE